MRKLLISILITVAVLENLSNAGDDPCMTKCENVHKYETENTPYPEVCSVWQQFLWCVKGACDNYVYNTIYYSLLQLNLVDINNEEYTCVLEY